ncbi:hypothetical protein BO71DRAFT_436856 [Aspergillus ellipticus CBS 707.79]|uniref:Uncharacterized protein n=1 Tax=Aspergillus ellipticus CBS 707.79 TaxID=1448320 RepID=A0A319DUS8_9EURO|nr:hypothetical protein BO71DRAFT_436856 [Aspergillus ellipticus CBS 707.79]
MVDTSRRNHLLGLPPARHTGMWREIITPSRTHTQHGTNSPDPIGQGCLGSRSNIADKSGYWGCYRQRMEAGATDRMKSSLPSSSSSGPGPKSHPGATSDETIPGRIHMTTTPSNLCFVVEGQDHTSLTPKEKAYWFREFDSLVTQWITDLANAGPDQGVLDKKLCAEVDSGRFSPPSLVEQTSQRTAKGGEEESRMEILTFNRKLQFFWFRDLRAMETIGKRNAGHVELRKKFLGAYGPGGEMSGEGDAGIRLWVETSVLKGGEVECEYVGCWAGTGLMGFEGEEGFC